MTALPSAPARPSIVVGIATHGRPAVLNECLRRLAGQTRRPDRVVVCPAGEGDFDAGAAREFGLPVVVVTALPGLVRQRNAILAACAEDDVVVFLDDDFLVADDFIETVDRCMSRDEEVVVATGRVLADGARGPGLTVAEGLAAIAASTPPSGTSGRPTYGAYGCNMILRLDPMRRHGLVFDERLPLYGWLEDIDLSRRLGRHGAIQHYDALRGVHLGTKTGRVSGRRLGYSQIANPVYLLGKGTVSARFALRMVIRNLAANLVRSMVPEPHVDRRGRLTGNLMALKDAIRGRSDPERVLEL